MKNRIFGNVNSIRVVAMDIHSTLLNAIITEYLFHPKELGIINFDSFPIGVSADSCPLNGP